MKNAGFSKREPWRVAGFTKREPWRVLGSLKGNLGEWLGSLRGPLQGSLLESPGFFTVARRNGIITAAELANKGPFFKIDHCFVWNLSHLLFSCRAASVTGAQF